jgi:hypothetical protein
MNFEDIKSTEDLETVSEEGIWQNFERLAGFIFEKKWFHGAVNTVKTHNKKRRQYDVITRKGDQVILAECKKWAGKAVERHKERTTLYNNITSEDAIPLLVTLIEEEIRLYEGVPLVSIQKLNSFVRDLDRHTGGTFFCDSKWRDNFTRGDPNVVP